MRTVDSGYCSAVGVGLGIVVGVARVPPRRFRTRNPRRTCPVHFSSCRGCGTGGSSVVSGARFGGGIPLRGERGSASA